MIVSSEPLLASQVHELIINLHEPYAWSVPPRIDDETFARALNNSLPSLTGIFRLNVSWGFRFKRAPQPSYIAQPTAALVIFAPLLVQLWDRVAPTLREARFDVYIDAIPVLATFNGSLTRQLVGFDLRVYGGILPRNVTFSDIECSLAEVAHRLVLPFAPQIKTLSVCFVPNTRERIFGTDPAQSHTLPPLFPAGFFKAIASKHFPNLRALDIEVPLGDDGKDIALFLGAHSSSTGVGSIRSLRLACTFSHPWTVDGRHGIAEFQRLIGDHGARWLGLHTLSLQLTDSGSSIRGSTATVVDHSYALPLLAACSNLQALTLTGEHLEDADDLRTMLHALQPACFLKKLAVKIRVVRPSVFDALAELTPVLEDLHLELMFTGTCSRSVPVDFDSDDSETEESPPFFDSWKLQPFQASESPFAVEMAGRRYDSWPLHKLSVIGGYAGLGDCLSTPMPQPPYATDVATALLNSIPGLVLGDVYPVAGRRY
jgi:hypothetical protein